MRRKDSFLLRNIGDQSFLVPLGAKAREINGLVSLNETGSFIWELLAEDRSIESLVVEVARSFSISEKGVQADIQSFLDDIKGVGALES